MFEISESDAKAICEINDREGVIAAALELRCRYPAVATDARAIDLVLSIIVASSGNTA